MSCHCSKECDAHQNSSFVFGLILGLIIGAVVAIIIYRNNKSKVFEDLKKQLTNFFDSLFPTPDNHNPTPKKSSAPTRKDVTIPSTLIAAKTETKTPPKSKPRVFKK